MFRKWVYSTLDKESLFFTDGTEIKAYGNNDFPKNYNDVFAEFNDLIEISYTPQYIEWNILEINL